MCMRIKAKEVCTQVSPRARHRHTHTSTVMKGIPRPGGGSQGNRSALVGCVAFSVMVGLGLSIGLAMKAGRGPPGDNGTTCSTSSEEGSAWTFDTPTQTDSCLDWVDGDSPQYPDDFSVLNFYRMYECAASNERIFMGNGGSAVCVCVCASFVLDPTHPTHSPHHFLLSSSITRTCTCTHAHRRTQYTRNDTHFGIGNAYVQASVC